MTEPEKKLGEPEKKPGKPNLQRVILIAALVFFLILFLREAGVLTGSGRLFK